MPYVTMGSRATSPALGQTLSVVSICPVGVHSCAADADQLCAGYDALVALKTDMKCHGRMGMMKF